MIGSGDPFFPRRLRAPGPFFIAILMAFHAEAKLPVSMSGLDAIYKKDDRELVTLLSPPKIQELAQSVALIVTNDHVNVGMFKTTISAQTLQEALNMCVNERFVTRPAIPGCTGFLVGPDLLASAGHCFENEDDCATKKIIFDVDSRNQSKKGYSVSSNSVYSCKKIISSMTMDLQDYSLIQLDRIPKRRNPLKLNLKNKIDDKAQVFMIGHPFGMPLMLSRDAALGSNSDAFQFTAALDSFEGNSGSPVFNSKTFEVEGILVNGQEDLVQDSKIGCYRNIVYDGKGNEGVFRASELLPYLK